MTRNLGSIPENAILVRLNVVGLYPSIPHEAGLKSFREVLNKRKQHSIPTSELISMADFVLKNNYFEFNRQIKQQICGITIGTTFTPPYTCLSMDKIETIILETLELQSWVWFGYIDEFFLSGHRVSKNFRLFHVVLMSSILTSNLHMSQAKKALYFLTLKLVLRTVRLLQTCMQNLQIAINISIIFLLVQTTPNDLSYLARLCALVGCALMRKTL